MTVQELIDHLKLMMLVDGLRPTNDVIVVDRYGYEAVLEKDNIYFEDDLESLTITM